VALPKPAGAHTRTSAWAIPSSSRWNRRARASRSGRVRGMLTLVASWSRPRAAASSGDDVGGSVMPSPAVHPARPLGSDSRCASG
jgi:hypothetical protein